MSRPEMRDNQASSAMRDVTLSRRDLLWAGAALAAGAAFAEPSKAAAPSKALALGLRLGWIQRCPMRRIASSTILQ